VRTQLLNECRNLGTAVRLVGFEAMSTNPQEAVTGIVRTQAADYAAVLDSSGAVVATAGRLPDGAGPLRFRVIQTSADGTTIEWSDLLPYGAPAPQHPALLVPYADAPPALPEVPGHHHGAGTEVLAVGGRSGSGWWTVALAGVAGALVAAGSVVLGRRQRRRFAALIDRDRRS
jgi:hypothetical protein